MKIFLSLLVVVLALTNVESGRKVQMPSKINIPSMKIWIIETVTNAITDGLENQIKANNGPVDSLATLIPPIEDPLVVDPIDIPLDINFDIDEHPIMISGFLNLTTETEIAGLSQLVNDLTIGGLPIAIDLNIQLPLVTITGEHSLEIEINLGTSKFIQGTGELNAHVSDVFAQVHAVTRANGIYLGIASLELDLGFQNLLIDGGADVWIDDTNVNWETISKGIQTWFDATWNGEVKCLVDRTLKCAVDYVIGRCTAVGLIGGECLRLELNEECLLLLDPADGECVQEVTTTKPGSSSIAPGSSSSAPGSSSIAPGSSSSAPGSSSIAPGSSSSAPGSTNAPVTEDTTVAQPETSQQTRETEAPGDDTTEKPTDKPSGSINVFSSPLFILLSFVVAIIKF